MNQIIIVCASVLCVILGVNLSVDPAHLLKPGARSSDETRITAILLAGQQAFVPVERIGFDERLTRQRFLERKPEADNSVIFGSSRVRYFSQKAFDDKRHFVDAMNAATLEDLLIFTHLRSQRKLLPKKLYIALDPWMIEQANSYTRLIQVSYPDAFVQAVDHFQFALPQSSARIYKNLASNAYHMLSVPFGQIVPQEPPVGHYQTVAMGELPFAGPLRVSFDGWITPGTYNWAWKVLRNGTLVDQGNYMDNLQGSASPHQPRSVSTKLLAAEAGDRITVQMAHANGQGAPVATGSQQYNATNLSARARCDSAAAQPYKGWTHCNPYSHFNRYRNYFPIAKEMISPAYFQQSLKSLWPERTTAAIPSIEAKSQCVPAANPTTYVFCSDGSRPWPHVKNYDTKKVENIVRTLDDGLVPLKTIDHNALKLLEQMTNFYVRQGTAVAYLLVPVHPFSYEKWKSENDSRGFIRAEATYRRFARAHGINIVGSYNPANVGCKHTDFRDWVHPLPRCTNQIASALKHLFAPKASGH